jgi:hypothetical protein
LADELVTGVEQRSQIFLVLARKNKGLQGLFPHFGFLALIGHLDELLARIFPIVPGSHGDAGDNPGLCATNDLSDLLL